MPNGKGFDPVAFQKGFDDAQRRSRGKTSPQMMKYQLRDQQQSQIGQMIRSGYEPVQPGTEGAIPWLNMWWKKREAPLEQLRARDIESRIEERGKTLSPGEMMSLIKQLGLEVGGVSEEGVPRGARPYREPAPLKERRITPAKELKLLEETPVPGPAELPRGVPGRLKTRDGLTRLVKQYINAGYTPEQLKSTPTFKELVVKENQKFILDYAERLYQRQQKIKGLRGF